MSMDALRERVAGERRRLREVRQAMTAAVEQSAGSDQSYVPFYIAIGDYFEAAMERLDRQDVRLGEMLRDKADLENPDNAQAIAELDERLAGNQQHLKRLLAARDTLAQYGPEGLASFEAAAKAYSDYIVTNMGHHPGSTDLAQALFSADDWQYMADVSEADQEREQALFNAVFAVKPDGLELPAEQTS